MSFSGLILTNAGRNELIKAEMGTPFQITDIVFGDGSYNGAYTAIKSLSHKVMELPVTKIERKGDEVWVECDFVSTDVPQAFYMREIGIIANGQLCYYDNAREDAEYIDPDANNLIKQKRMRFVLLISGDIEIHAQIASSLYALETDLRAHESTQASADASGHVQLSDATDVTDSTGLALPATEKNAALSGTLANQVAVLREEALPTLYQQLTQYTDKEIADLINGAPGALDTLGKIASALTGHTGNKSNPHAVTKAQVGLGNVNNTSDANKPVSTAQQAALDALYQQLTQYTDKEIADLVNGAPGTLNTLGEIADAMQDNADVVTALEQAIGTKAGKAETESALAGKVSRAGGDMTGNLTMGNTSMSDAPEIHWIDKFRKIWAGMCNGAGDWYLYDATNNKSIIHSTKAGVANFYGNAASATNATQDGNGNNIVNTYLTKTGDSKDNTVTFTSTDVADGSATAWTSVAKLTTGEKISSLFNKMSTMFKNLRYLYKLLGTTNISAIGGGTVTGAISKLNTDLSTKVSDSGDTMIGPLYLGNGAGTNSPAIVWWDKNRNVWAGTANGGGDFYLYDHTNSKHIIQSTKAGVNNFNGHAVSAGTATYAQNATGNLRTEIDNLNANIPLQHIVNVTVRPTALNTDYTYTNAALKGKKVIAVIFYSSVGEVFVTQYTHAHGALHTKADNQYWGGEVEVRFNSSTGTVTFKVVWIGTSQSLNNFSLTDIVY